MKKMTIFNGGLKWSPLRTKNPVNSSSESTWTDFTSLRISWFQAAFTSTQYSFALSWTRSFNRWINTPSLGIPRCWIMSTASSQLCLSWKYPSSCVGLASNITLWTFSIASIPSSRWPLWWTS
jgi:hypothetical protein